MGMINQIMQMVQQMTQQQQGSEQCSQGGGGNDPAQMFQQVLQQLTQGQGQGYSASATPCECIDTMRGPTTHQRREDDR
jgi:hypothetical protein